MIVLAGDPGPVFSQFLQVVRCDPGLTSNKYSPIWGGVPLLSFVPRNPLSPSQRRVQDLIATQTVIVVLGCAPLYVLPDGDLLYNNAGGAMVEPDDTDPTIKIYLDVTNYAGIGYVVHDQTFKKIGFPLPIILYHELAHAKQFIDGPWPDPSDPNFSPKIEIPAAAEENKFRSQIGLPQRHPTDHYGEPGAAPAADMKFPLCQEPFKHFWCLIATAATGSPHAAEVQGLRAARDRYRNLSTWSARTATPLLDAYGRLSPIVVRDMHRDPELRRAILLYCVQPFFHLTRIVDELIRSEANPSRLAASVAATIDRYVGEVTARGGSLADLGKAADGATHGAAELLPGRPFRREADRTDWAAQTYPYLARSVRSVTSDVAGFRWAFVGAADFLSVAAAQAEVEDASADAYLGRLIEWLADVPVPAEAIHEADLAKELGVLSEKVFRRPAMRAAFAEALLTRFAPPESGFVYDALVEGGHVAANEQPSDARPVE